MGLTNIQSDNGFVSVSEIVQRLHKYQRSPRFRRTFSSETFEIRKTEKSDFAEIGVMVPVTGFGPQMFVLFRIYAGTEELYNIIRQMFEQATRNMGLKCKCGEWKRTSC